MTKNQPPPWKIWGILALVVLGAVGITALWSMPAWRGTPDAVGLQVLGGRLLQDAAMGGATGGESSLSTRWLLAAFQNGGLDGLWRAWFLLGQIPTFLALLGVGFCAMVGFYLLGRVRSGQRRFWRGAIWVVVIAGIGVGTWRAWSDWSARPPLEEKFPGKAWLEAWAGHAEGAPVFANAGLRAKAALLAPDLRTDPSPEISELVRDPLLWRERNREFPVRGVLLDGRIEEFGPLLTHLLDAPDWKLAEVSPYGLVFWKASDFSPKLRSGEAIRIEGETLRRENGREARDERNLAVLAARQALVHAQVGQFGEGRRLLNAARARTPDRAEVLALSAAFLALREQWPEAATEATEALKLQPGLAAAWQVRLQCELAMGQPRRASESAREFENHAGADDFSWFLIARAAHEGKDPSLEIRALEKLVALSRARGLPTGPYLIYLGQAQVGMGLDRDARDSWTSALKSGELTPAQTKQVGELLERLNEATRFE